MTYWFRFLLIALALLASPPAHAQGKTQVRLLLSHQTAQPGDMVMVGVEFKMRPLWHIYWRNPGESGIPTKIDWDLPKGVTAGEIQWPIPEKAFFSGLNTYEYHGEIILLVPLKIAADAVSGTLELRAKVSWLECEANGACVPGKSEVDAALTIGNESKAGNEVEIIDAAKKKLPQTAPVSGALAGWEKSAQGETRPLVIEWDLKDKMANVDFFPYASDAYEIAVASDTLSLDGGKARLRKAVKKTGGDWPQQIQGLLVEKSAANEAVVAHEVSLTIPPEASPAVGVSVPVAEPESLVKMLWFAFVGGLILNIMPCVFPVIALKILGFVNQSKEAPRQVLKLGLLYSLGVVVSFLVMAGLVIAVKSSGGAASWGMQMQNPQFSVALTTLVLLVALNLFGLFEVTLSGSAMGAASGLASQEGSSGAFFNGVFATVLATPCTAPFLAPALGFAFAQPPAIILLMFVTVGVGLACPYLILSWHPAWLRFLPRPGAWMEKFKIAMGFPMLATAIWLFSFTAKRFGDDGPLWLGLFLVVVALAMWVWGEFVQRGRQRKGLAMAVSLLLLGLGYAYALEGELHWRSPARKVRSDGVVQSSPEGIAWQKWSVDAVAKARAEGHPVLVDFTADWCLTCKANKRTSIEIPATRAKLKEINAVALLGDNTDEDPAIVVELKKYQRAGVPLVLVYPRDAAKPPLVLPAFLTPGIMLEALQQAAK